MASSSSSSSSSSKRAKLVVPTRCRCRLPSDIITWEILPRLPVRTLCKFRCVSKSWYHLLSSDPELLELHRRRSEQQPPTLLVITHYLDANRTPFFTMKMDIERRVAGSAADLRFNMRPMHNKVSACRGLVLVYNQDTMRVWNPATGERIDIKVPVRRNNYDHMPGQDFLWEEIAAAIGYVESTGEYKLLFFHTRYETSCQVLTIGGSGGWRATKNPPPFSFYFSKYDVYNIAVVNGFVHALPKCPSDPGIARFDLEKEEWSVIPDGIDRRHPSPRYGQSYHLLLREVGGFLCLVQTGFSERWYRADIWLLRDYDKGIWVKEYTIDIPYDSYYVRRGRWVEPLTIEEDGRIMFTSFNLLFYYDPKSKSFQKIYKNKADGRLTIMLSTLYAETFASLKRGKIGRIDRSPAV